MSNRITIASVLAVLFAGLLTAQITGNVKGTVLDASGATVSSAKVTITSKETGETRKQFADSEGRFVFNQLKIGAYSVKAEASGFRVEIAEAEVRTGETVGVTFTLEVGQLTEAVTVSDAVSSLDTANAQIQQAMDAKDIAEMPVRRDPLQFALTAPGVVPVTANNPFLGQGSFNSNGGRGRGNNITVDNIISTDLSTTGNGGSQLGPLAFSQIKEVQVITNNFNAEYGRNGNAQLMFITKSGTNQFHGEAYEFLRNHHLNARAFFDRSGNPDITHRNQFGYALGGPIKRNKIHFFTTYEPLQLRGAGGTRTAQVPTAAMLAQVTDATSKKILDTYQLPAAQTANANFGTVQQSGLNFTKAFQFSFRVDYQISDKDTIYARYGHYQSEAGSPGNTFVNTNLANFGLTSVNGPRNFNLSETHLFSPTIVNEFRAAFGRSSPIFAFASTVPIGLPRIQFSNNQIDQFGHWDGGPQGRVQNTFQYSDSISFVKGSHNLKAGADVLRYQLNSFLDSAVRGVLLFADWNSFAAGTPTQYTQSFGSTLRGLRETNHFYFVQDDWKVTRNFTVNLGFRMEVATPVSEINGILANIDLSCHDAIGNAGTGPLGCLALHKPIGQTNVNPGPRLGFAWSLNPKTVVRGGYGIAYDFNYLNPISNVRTVPPFINTLQLSGSAISGANSYANLVAGGTQAQRDGAAAVGSFNPTWKNFGRLGTTIDSNYKNPQTHQWSIGIEREVLRDLVVKTTYVGTKTNFLQRQRPINLINPSSITPATSLADETARLSSFLALQSGSNATFTGLSNRIDPRFNEVLLFDSGSNSHYHAFEFSAVKKFSMGYSMTAAYTFSKSIDDTSDALNVLINDLPLQQNPNDGHNNRGPSQFDLQQRLSIAHVFELPFGKHMGNPALRRIVSGWGISGITTFRTGLPVTFDGPGRRGLSPLTLTGSTTSPVRPNSSGPFTFNPVPSGSAGAYSTTNGDAVAPISAYAASLGLSQPLIGNFGSLGRNVVRANGQTTFDWNFYKNTAITERFNLQFRAEIYNLFNTPTFQQVNRTITNPAFGQYTDTALDSRTVQLGMRLVF